MALTLPPVVACLCAVSRILVAYQLAVRFKLKVYHLVRSHAAARRDYRDRAQLQDAASSVEANIAEGWRRFAAKDMSVFLRYALGSLEETKSRLQDGVHRGYFTLSECSEALELGNRCGAATMGLWKSLKPFKRGSSSRDQRTKGPKAEEPVQAGTH